MAQMACKSTCSLRCFQEGRLGTMRRETSRANSSMSASLHQARYNMRASCLSVDASSNRAYCHQLPGNGWQNWMAELHLQNWTAFVSFCSGTTHFLRETAVLLLNAQPPYGGHASTPSSQKPKSIGKCLPSARRAPSLTHGQLLKGPPSKSLQTLGDSSEVPPTHRLGCSATTVEPSRTGLLQGPNICICIKTHSWSAASTLCRKVVTCVRVTWEPGSFASHHANLATAPRQTPQ